MERYGAEKSVKRDDAVAVLERLAGRIAVLPLDAAASAEKLVLATNNQREFVRVGGLKLENWV